MSYCFFSPPVIKDLSICLKVHLVLSDLILSCVQRQWPDFLLFLTFYHSKRLHERSEIKLSGGSDGKESACDAGDPGSIPGLERSPGGEHGNPLQYPCLENPMDRGALGATVHGVTKSQTRLKWLSIHTCIHIPFFSLFLLCSMGNWHSKSTCHWYEPKETP